MGSLWIVVRSLWVVVDRCGSLWIVVARCGSFRVLVTTLHRHIISLGTGIKVYILDKLIALLCLLEYVSN